MWVNSASLSLVLTSFLIIIIIIISITTNIRSTTTTMAPIFHIILFFLSLALSLASQPQPHSQSPPSTQPAHHTTWASLLLTHYSTPLPHLTHPYPTLTPLGATQAYTSGSLIRRRYLTGPSNNLTDFMPLQGFDKSYLDNQRVQVLAGPEQYAVASAWAVLRGLYPPLKGGGVGGYQFGRVETAGGADFNSVWYVDPCCCFALLGDRGWGLRCGD